MKRANGWRLVEEIAALLIHRGLSKCRAAEMLGVTRRCLQKWFNAEGTLCYSGAFPRFFKAEVHEEILNAASELAKVLPPHKVAAIYSVPCQALFEV